MRFLFSELSFSIMNQDYNITLLVTKYRYHMLKGDIALRVKELVRQTCEAFEIRIISGVVSKDQVHIYVSAPPTIAPSEIMRRIKRRTASKLFDVQTLCLSLNAISFFFIM